MPSLVEKIKDLWKPKPAIQHSVRELQIGQFVEVSYKHPSQIGIVDGKNLTCTRLNPDEIDNRKIQGVVIQVVREELTRTWLLGIRVHKTLSKATIQRDFLFMEYEIEKLRILN